MKNKKKSKKLGLDESFSKESDSGTYGKIPVMIGDKKVYMTKEEYTDHMYGGCGTL